MKWFRSSKICLALIGVLSFAKEQPIIYKTFVFLASFVVVLTLLSSAATGGIVFLDDFEDGSATDGAPVTWSPVPGATGSFEVVNGDYVLTRPQDIEEMYSTVNQNALGDTSVRTQARLIGSSAWWFGLFARVNLTPQTAYIALLRSNGNFEIWLFGPSSAMLASAHVPIDPRVQDVLLRFDVIGNRLSAWAWREGDPMPTDPQVTAVHSGLTLGFVGLACDLGNRLSDSRAIFRYVEVYKPIPPSPDFNGDGTVDFKDFSKLAQYWGQDESSVDIAPLPFGDNIVNFTDLAVFAENWLVDFSLVAHWKLDETEGAIAYDSISNKKGYLIGNPIWQPDGGKINGALQFDGTNDYVSTPFVLNPASGQFSAIVWVKGSSPGQVILSQQASILFPQGKDWLCADPAGGKLMTALTDGSPSTSPLVSECVITDGNWHCIGVTWDGSRRRLYADGIKVAEDSSALTNLVSSDKGLYLGAGRTLTSGTFWFGLIDDVRIYNRAVSP